MQIGSSTSSLWSSLSTSSQQPKRVESNNLADIDTDSSGSLSKDEFLTALKGATESTSQDDQFFRMIDTDSSGEVSETEWTTFQEKSASRPSGGAPMGPPPSSGASSVEDDEEETYLEKIQNFLMNLFKAADTDEDGEVSESEMTALVEQMKTSAMSQDGTASGSTTTATSAATSINVVA